MHSRKSIFKKGIVFLASVFAMAVFSFVKVDAACEVTFNDGNQYLTIGGDKSSWDDNKLGGCPGITVHSIEINGKAEDAGVTAFTVDERGAGHYTVGYNYSYSEDGSTKTGKIYRYVRILDSSFSTSNNYSLATFDFDKASSVIDSFSIGNYYFANFVVSNGSTHLVVKDALGRNVLTNPIEIKYETAAMSATRVIRDGNKYYVIGNSENKGVFVSYTITVDSGAVDATYLSSFASLSIDNSTYTVYNSGFVYNQTVYLVGKDNNGYPRIDSMTVSGAEEVYTHTVKGEYKGITVANNTIYAVGYTKGDSDSIPSGLYTYIQSGEVKNETVLEKTASTTFYDIAYDVDSGKNIIVGETAINQIYANNALVATNKKQGYHDGVILQVALDGKSINGAYMFGGSSDDAFYQIKSYENDQYVVVGKMDNGIASLVYTLKTSTFEATPHITSANSDYLINGFVKWEYGYAYYGNLDSTSAFGVYYPKTISGDYDALFAVLDNRTFENFETINLVKGNEYKYCDTAYSISFGGSDNKFASNDCKNDSTGSYNTQNAGVSTRSIYEIPTDTEGTILIYRIVNVNEAPTPTDLRSYTTGILKWHVYNRSYTYVTSNAQRLDTTNFNYKFTNTNIYNDYTIEQMIEYYFENGNTDPFELTYDASATNEFLNSKQTSAAFTSVEMARKYAYYQEFSRVIRIDGQKTTIDQLGAYRYTGTGAGEQVIDGNDFYIYYIDFRGNNQNGYVSNCSVSPNLITNCTAKGGYAFSSLNDVKRIIEYFIEYNNYFVSSRNTIYNGSIEASDVSAYSQELTTKEYLKQIAFKNKNTNLTFNVAKDGAESAIQLANKDVYFGGSATSDTVFSYPSMGDNISVVKKTAEGITYYESNNAYFFADNLCYKVYYSYGSTNGTSRIFCLDTIAPQIVYKKDGADSESIHSVTDVRGTRPDSPLFIEDDFKISSLLDLDEYTFIRANGNVYTLGCEKYSETCENDVNKYIRQAFRYDKNDPMGVKSITFYDRMMNPNVFYFVVGTIAPTISAIENDTKTGFTLIIDFYEKNPIVAISADYSRQDCAGVADGCYKPSKDDLTSITNSKAAFNEALQNYIFAISYRDNSANKEDTLTIETVDGIYEITHTIDGKGKTIKYVIQDGYFVEYQGYEEKYYLDENNLFEYREETYWYNALTGVVQLMKDEEGEYVVDSSKDPMPVLDNVFKFEENGKEYTILSETTKDDVVVDFVSVLPQKYEIYNGNLFELNGIVYTVDFDNQVLSYTNPEISQMKHVEIVFDRTVDDSGVLSGGVDIPATKRIVNDQGIEQFDPNTGLAAYEFIKDAKPLHFNLVDGVYTFTISQSFKPETKTIETKINVKDLEIKLGHALNHTDMEIKKGYQFTFDSSEDTSSTIALGELNDNFKYPISPEYVSSSNLDSYSTTYFMNKPVYATYQTAVSSEEKDETTVFIIRIYENKNAYGLPFKERPTACQEIIIYSNYSGNNPVQNKGCTGSESASVAMTLDQAKNNASLLSDYGIVQTMDDTGAFGFNGQNKFYFITLVTYQLNETGGYKQNTVKAINSFYIDSVSPESSIVPHIYDDSGDINDKTFTLTEGVYKLNDTVGSTIKIGFKVNWYGTEADDYNENKLMLMTITDEEQTYTCNLFQLISNPAYVTDCRNYIDVVESSSADDDFEIVFSASGNYYISFHDASGNGIAYSFAIDKSAPIVKLIDAKVNEESISYESSNEGDVLNYVLLSYVKNPSFTIRLEDLSPVERYCYYFDYGQAEKKTICIDGSSIEYTFSLKDYKIDNVDADAYLTTNNKDQNVILYVWAEDSLNNTGKDSATQVNFWADYYQPSAQFETSANLNTQYIEFSDIDQFSSRDNTITVLSITYSSNLIECPAEGFSFQDARHASTNPPYTFKVTCEDIHTATSAQYPVTKNFSNMTYMKFYESDGTTKLKDQPFVFSDPNDGRARWIYITVVDGVGNESEDYIILPIIIEDEDAPVVVNQYKGEGQGFEPVRYTYPNGVNTLVYLANQKITVVFSEPIESIKECNLVVANNDEIKFTGACDDSLYGDGYASGDKYLYSESKVEFTFENVIDKHYKIITIEVLDFAGWGSGVITIVIDRVAPTINFDEVNDGGKDEVIKYILSSDVYGEEYRDNGYVEHVYTRDDQGAKVDVNIIYEKYSPSITYKNYVLKNGKFETIADKSTRSRTTTYYLLVKSDLVVNKKCVSKQQDGYCFVEDTQSYYYFNSLLTDESGKVWKDTIDQIDSSSIGVYRITYYATDYAGNVSSKIYKKVFVNDTDIPDIDIYDSSATKKLYGNLTSNNPDNFEGKLNQIVSFVGTDSTARNSDTRIVLYKCSISDYQNATCDIDQNLYTDNTKVSRGESTSNIYNIGTKLKDGVYKTFVYDYGSYLSLDSTGIKFEGANLDEKEKVYSLTHNTSSFYFAIRMRTIEAKYVVNGNLYTDAYSGPTQTQSYLTYNYSKDNYYTVTNGSDVTDVYLARYDKNSKTYVNAFGTSAIGYNGVVEYNVDGDIVTILYKDGTGENAKVVYEVRYQEYDVIIDENGKSNLMLHETYHNIDLGEKTVEICKMINGVNPCDSLPTVYQVVSVKANIYPEGSYLLKMVDRYGNYSQDVEEFLVDNIAFTDNKVDNKATGVNYWYSVPSQVVTPSNKQYLAQLVGVANDSDINALDAKFSGNFNSEFFYAFASKADAKQYLTTIYRNAISTQIAQGLGYTFYGIDGEVVKTYSNESIDVIMGEITTSLSDMIFTTYTKNKNFSDDAIKQKAYDGNVSSSMYEYVYLLVTTTIGLNGKVTYDYALKGDTCVEEENEQCIKVELKIVKASDTSIYPKLGEKVETICRTSGTFESASGCNFDKITTGAKYIFVDREINKYHVNVVYYGITAYTETADVNFNEVGDYIPLEQFAKYSAKGNNEYEEDENGSYIWLDSKYVLLDGILTTNIYKKTCTFNTQNYEGCVFVSYLSRFNLRYVQGQETYIPSATGVYYYNYYDGRYYEKTDAMAALGVDSTYSEQGNRCDSSNCNNVPVKVSESVIKTSFETKINRPVNKKVFIELFNSSTNSKLFEVKAIKIGDRYTEVYSYATVSINGIYYNLNNSKYLTISADGTSYRCVIDIELEKSYDIIIRDRAGNQVNIAISHSSVTPTITYTKSDDTTKSNVIIATETTSLIANLVKSNLKVYKYGEANNLIENNYDASCLTYLENLTPSATAKYMSMRFNYDAYNNCSGVYRIEIADNHGNTNYKEFVFNPYEMATLYNLTENKFREYTENEISGVITNDTVRVDINSKINYMVISRYPSYSNLDLQEPTHTVEITDFTSNHQIGTCGILISKIDDDNYSVYIGGGDDHSCDGIYTVDLVNNFSKTIMESQFKYLEGANQELITYRVGHGASKTVEIDTIAPDTSVMNSDTEQRFALHIDEGVANYQDTKKLLEDAEKTITYTNKYITVSWGGYETYSFASLKYRILSDKNPDAKWETVSENVTYNHDYTASYLFKQTEQGVYTIEFMFTDFVGNEDASQTFTIIITIEAPRVAFYETNATGTIIGDEYKKGERIADRTILQCSFASGSGYETRDCTMADYDYVMLVNNREYPDFYEDIELGDVISRNSMWMIGQPAQYDEELIISLTISVKDKRDIKTELLIIIDKKAPTIEFDGTIRGSTYTGNLTITISQDDITNHAFIYKCDLINEEEMCLIKNSDGDLVEGSHEFGLIDKGSNTYTLDNQTSGYFYIRAVDDLGNGTSKWFKIDNQAPTIVVEIGENNQLAPNTYTNASSVFVNVKDALSETGATFTIEYVPLNEEDAELGDYISSIGLTKEGKYTLVPTDAVGNVGRGISFYIYRQTPEYTILTDGKENSHIVNTKVSINWEVSDKELVAPIVSVVVDGKLYEAEFNSVDSKYVGKEITTIGEHTFVITDAAGNRAVTMVTINNTKKVCINGNVIDVKMQAYYNVDNLIIGNEEGVNYQKDDVIIFALPSQVTGGDCMSAGLLGYRTLDKENSHYLINSDKNAQVFNNTKTGIDFVSYGFISQEAIKEIKNVGGTVVVFVVTKDIANNTLGYKVGTNFFMEDPVGWTMIFLLPCVMVWPAVRVFIKKKVRVI